ncbi:patched domain-containing protein 3-like [Pecten maximus]|uniref:patched domain-containing protein 3-like n=1 Tax=Pecten maximus TaxID=6579 RepID=UPI0014584254|nr:patched domain-containing protein 3-like [Pecten maximus]
MPPRKDRMQWEFESYERGSDDDNLITMAVRTFYTKYEDAVGVVFEMYAGAVYKHPRSVLGFCVLYNCLFGLGFLRFSSETDMEKLFTPKNNEALTNTKKINEIFQNKSRNNFYPKVITNLNKHAYGGLIVRSKGNSSLLRIECLNELKRIDEIIRYEVQIVNDSGSNLHYEDVCVRKEGRCVVSGDFVLTKIFTMLMKTRHIPYPYFVGRSLSGMFGNVGVVDGRLVSASMLRMMYHLRQDTDEDKQRSLAWETSYVNKLKHLQTNITHIAFRSSASVTKEIGKSIFEERKFILTIVFMLAYAAFAISGGNCVSGRHTLAIAGVMSSCLAVLGSFGAVSGTGVKFISICGVIPFLIIGIGLDDMFILMACMVDTPKTVPVRDRVKKMMRTGGVAITMTSLTDFSVFMVGSTSVFSSVQYFCIYTGVAVLFCYLNQLLFVVPCIIINERRTYEWRHCITCQETRSYKQLRDTDHTVLLSLCCGGEPPKSLSDSESPLDRYPKRLAQKGISYTPVKVGSVLLYIGYLGMAIYGAMNVCQNFSVSYLVPEDSYVHQYLSWLEKDFPNEVVVSFVIDGELDYSHYAIQQKVAAMLKRARKEPFIQRKREINWLLGYKLSPYYNSSNDFIEGLKAFLKSRKDYEIDVVFDETGHKIKSSRFYVISKDIRDSKMTKSLLTCMRTIAKESGLPVIAHAPIFIIGEQLMAIGSSTLQTMLIAMVATLVITAVAMPHPLIIAIVCISMVSILTGMYGFMYMWGLSLSSITMVQLIMSIGFSVDFCAKICHAYISAVGSNRTELVASAISRAGGAIISAAVSSIIGVVMLAFTSSYVLKSFFKIMVLMMVFGLLHALLFLPVVLLTFGPRPRTSGKTEDIEPSNTVSTITLYEGREQAGPLNNVFSVGRTRSSAPQPVGNQGTHL